MDRATEVALEGQTKVQKLDFNRINVLFRNRLTDKVFLGR